MKKILPLVIVMFAFFTITASSQTTNYRAQGNYYSAKKNYEAKAYTDAIAYVKKSKTALGGTNEELQYLHILSAYKLDLFEEAKKEMEIFFDIGDKKIKAINFDKSVDRLTTDETRELTMLMDPIFELADKKKNHPCAQCSGTGLVAKMISVHCTNCGEEDNWYYVIDYTDGSGRHKKGPKYTEQKGKTKTLCTKCNGVGREACKRCDGWPTGKCKGCTEITGLKGMAFFCQACDGNGYNYSICQKCKGTKYYASISSSKTTCTNCNGRGF